jgi:RHS repeat-associated protein
MNQGANDYFYLHDHLYSPVALLDDTGAVVERYEYDAYGSVQILTSNFSPLTSSQYGNPYAFTGRELDVLDGGALHHMHYRHRDYSPILARFFQPDPKGYVDSMSLYAYVINNPIILLDPYGTKSTDSYLRRQVDAYFSNIGSYFLGTDIYSITGLDQLISKLSLVKIDKFKESGDSPEFVVTYRNKTIMRLIKLEEEDFKRSLLTNKHESTFHEFVHAYLYSIGLYQPEVWHEDRNNEGIAYASHELYGWVIDFRAFIEKKIEILESNPSKEEREEALKLLKTEWPRAWARLNSYRSWSGRTNYSPPDGYGFDPGRYFNITTMDISRVRKHLGFSISCDSLAERYNKRIEGLEGCECVKFKCKIGNPNAPEIWLSEPLDRIFE